MKTKLKVAKALWEDLTEIPINEDSEIEDSFLSFEKGTHILEIWAWFEEKFEVSVAKDLMGV